MFKKFLILLLLVGGVLSSNAIKNTKAQEEIQVSPRVWVKDSNAVNEITVHVAYPWSSDLVFTLSIDGFSVAPSGTFADDRGELVIKFIPDMGLYSVEIPHNLRVDIGEMHWETTFSVKDLAVPNAPGEDIVVIESGDKVRGTEGEGAMELNCENWDGSNGEPCPYGDYDPFESEEIAQTQQQESAAEEFAGGDVVIESGDKVRGNEGQGVTNQNQTEEPNCWDTSWCEPEGSFGE